MKKHHFFCLFAFLIMFGCGSNVQQIDTYSNEETLCAADLNSENTVVSDITNLEFLNEDDSSSILSSDVSLFNRFVGHDTEDAFLLLSTNQGFALKTQFPKGDELAALVVDDPTDFDLSATQSMLTTTPSFSDLQSCLLYDENDEFALTSGCSHYFDSYDDGYYFVSIAQTITRHDETSYSMTQRFLVRDLSIDFSDPSGIVHSYALSFDFQAASTSIVADYPVLTKSCDGLTYRYSYTPDLSAPSICPSDYTLVRTYDFDESANRASADCEKCLVTDENESLVLDGEDAVNAGDVSGSTTSICQPTSGNNQDVQNLLE